MNIFGLFAVIFACAAVVTCVAFVCFKGIRVYKSSEDVTKRPQIEDCAKPLSEDPPKKNAKTTENIVSMDAVIQAANEVMGITTVTKEDD